MRFYLGIFTMLFLFPAWSRAGQVIFTEVMYHPIVPLPEYVEMTNLTSNRLDMARWKVSGGIAYTFPDFDAASSSAHFLKEYERVVLSSADEATTRAAWPAIPPSVRVFGPWVGTLGNKGDVITLQDAAAAQQTTLHYGDSKGWPLAADGAGHSLQIIRQNGKVDDWRNWRASRYVGGSPGVAEPVLAEEPISNAERLDRTVVDYTSAWKYWRNAADPDGAGAEGTWRTTGFDDAAWVGPSPGFFGEDPSNPFLQGQRGTSFTTGYTNARLTYYFRTTFQWPGAATGNSFAMDQWVDDGVIYYLNGTELKGPNLGRTRMPAGVATHTSTTNNQTPIGGDAVEELNALSGSLDGQLVVGTNLLCAEVHQQANANDDVYFGARLRITAPPSSGVVINEVRPMNAVGLGFVEFYNGSAAAVDLNGYYLSDSDANLTKFRITTPLLVPAGGFASVGFSESSLTVKFPVVVILTAPDGFTRQNGFQTNMVADGRSAGRQTDGGSAWVLFAESTRALPNLSLLAPTLALNEVSFVAATGRTEWVEFYNPGTVPQALDALYLSSSSNLSDRRALTGNISASGFASVAVDFATDAGGTLVLYVSDVRNNVVATAKVTRRLGLPSVQAWPQGAGEWFATPVSTRDAANNPERSTAIVITEIMAKPPSGHEEGAYLELYNQSAATVDLTGWRFSEGISYSFPAGSTLAAGAYLVVAKSPSWMTANYSGLTQVYGPYGGTIKNSGEELRLEDTRGNVADEVNFYQGGQWPSGAGGEGSSLELMHPAMDNSQPSAWRASDETTKSTFQSYSYTGTYKQLRGIRVNESTYKELLIHLAGDGYVILRNIKLTKSTAPTANLILTGDTTSHNGSGATGFLCTGTHCDSDSQPRVATPARYDATLTTEAGFHLISQGGGDTKGNKVEVDVIGIAPNDVLTLTFEARWVYGLPLMVAQTWDRSFGNVFRFPIPNNLGTPGAVNSRSIVAAAPTVDGMAHFPAVPTAMQPVLVTARVTAAGPLTEVSVQHRLDIVTGNAAWSTVAMNDSGTGGDARAGDGLWSATIPGRGVGLITQFYITATAANGQENQCPRQGARRSGMWITSNTPPSTVPGLLTQRSILSLNHRRALDAVTGFGTLYDWDHPRMSNYGFNATFIFNETEVLYNCELRRGGSPWTRVGTDALDRTRWKTPGDQLFRERSKSGIDNDSSTTFDGGVKRFHNRMVRYLLYLFGYPVPEAEFVIQIVNADPPRLGDDLEPTDTDFFDRAYPDGSQGQLFEIDDAWYLYDTVNAAGEEDRIPATEVTGRWALTDWADVNVAAAPSDESPIFFHGNWPLRFPEERYDYAALSAMIKTSTNNGVVPDSATDAAYREKMERVLDVERTAIYAVVRGYAGDWDSFTMNRGKNAYFYKRPGDGRFEFHHWDSDLAFQNDHLTDPFLGRTAGLGWTNLTDRPWFKQRFNHYLSVLIDRYTSATSGRMTAWLAALNYQSTNLDSLAAFKTNNFDYRDKWFRTRNAAALPILGTDYTRSFSIVTPVPSGPVSTPVFSLMGLASTKVAAVQILGHPEAVFAPIPTGADLGLWSLTNIRLASGVNNLTIRAVFSDGTVSATKLFSVTLSVNGPPVVSLVLDPSSGNLAVGENLLLNAAGSMDPEGLALSYAWSVIPSTGAVLTEPERGKANVRFNIPGSYTISLQVTDAASQTTPLSRSLSVYNAAGFSSFGSSGTLSAEYTLANLEFRDNFSPSTWYSLEDLSGRLLIQVLEDVPRPLAAPTFNYPQILRDLPDSADFILQTSLLPDSREFGSWQAGLVCEINQGGSLVRYVFGVDGGVNLIVKRAALPADYVTVFTTSITGRGAILRLVRNGALLRFERQVAGDWVTVFTQTMAAGSVAGSGGLFLATSAATSARVAFDYLLVADPSVTNSVLSNLRLTELNYRPAAGGVEFIELRNTGTQAINLSGVKFALGQPFAMLGNPATAYLFGTEILAPSEFITITDNVVGFRQRYGNGPRLGPAWTSGSLSNSGEKIILLDSVENAVHDFSYSPLVPWPVAANGAGSSLEVLNVNGNYDDGNNWRASLFQGGSPGLALDRDGDGATDEAEALFGTNPAVSSSAPMATLATIAGGDLRLTWPSVPGVVYRVETSTSLAGWTTVQTLSGIGTWSFTPLPGEPLRFYRVVAAPAS